MYNVEEAYMATIKSGSKQFKELLTITKKQIQCAIKEGKFETNLDIAHVARPVHDIDRLQEFLVFLGYSIERIEYTNDITRLHVQWTETEFKNYLDKK
jgi:hypothetical protein